jgi:GTP-binding protein
MKVISAEFITGAVAPHQYPSEQLPEIAFAGRSNVGKSSLLNSLLNRKKLVKTSSTPGKTQQINFFRINENMIFTDLPGYGYAKVPRKLASGWQDMVEGYLLNRETLRAVVLLLDIRRDPTEFDLDMKAWLEDSGLDCIFVATKSDKLTRNEKNRQLAVLRKAFTPLQDRPLIPYSSQTHEGNEELWREILSRME